MADTGFSLGTASVPQTGHIFALDIGTRSIIGIVGRREENLFRVLDVEVQEHRKRAMVDGQIEDIAETTAVAGAVKRRLEQRLGESLDSVYVAAAGRALRTLQTTGSLELSPQEAITQQQIHQLEMSAVEEAYRIIAEEGGEENLYCVGHSVMRYHLDDYPISTLLGHRGREAKVEIIATFLPGEVVESLYSTMAGIQCTVASITLEPIAAMNMVIPEELRMLNLALVDIGAGTSDIAISDRGSVVAYTMATVAGDELTEAIVRDYLVDFATAEQMKRQLSTGTQEITYSDILGFEYALSAAELLERLQGSVEALSGEICRRIVEVNGKAPAAVFLVGGGSQMPGLCEAVAAGLSMDRSKVAVGGSNYMKRMILSEADLAKPEFATPMGIAVTAMRAREQGSIPVTVDGRELRLYKNTPMTVMDVLLMSGFKQSQLLGRSGRSVTFQLNGQKKVVRGSYATPASIEIGGKAASLATLVSAGDNIAIRPAVWGEDARPLVGELAKDWVSLPVTLNGVAVTVGTMATLGGLPTQPTQQIRDLDEVTVYTVETLADLCREAKLELGSGAWLVNGRPRTGDYRLRPGDDVRHLPQGLPPEPETATQKEEAVAGEAPQTEASQAWTPGAEPPAAPTAAPEGQPIRIRLNDRGVELSPKADGTPYLFVDLLNFVDIDPQKPQGNILLRINDREASYLDTVSEGDSIEIRWEAL